MNQAIIQYEDLQNILGGSSPANVVVRLINNKIPYKLGRSSRPFTTVAALNKALGITSLDEHTLESKDSKSSTPEVEIL